MGNPSMIHHICRAEDWASVPPDGAYEGSPQDRADGFIHFSTSTQVAESAARHRAGEAGLVLLTVDAARLGASLRWEASRGGQLFPHLYGPLPAAAVVAVEPLPLAGDGRHVFPPRIAGQGGAG